MSVTVMVDRDVDGSDIYETSSFTFSPGVTVLLGCNGCGKTTLMKRVEQDRSCSGKPTYWYDIKKAESTLGLRSSWSGKNAAEYILSNYLSEGERIKNHFGMLVSELGQFMNSLDVLESREAWIFFDSLDSGWSIDNCREFSEFTDVIFETKPEGVDVYFLMAVNSYEFTRREDWTRMDVQTGKEMGYFETYGAYADYVMSTRDKKNEIWG